MNNLIYKNIDEVFLMASAHDNDGRRLLPEHVDRLKQAAIVFNEKEIIWTGPTKSIPKEYQSFKSKDLSGFCLTPEVIDSHTHLVFGGNRASEYRMRLNGADYQAISKAGGGILETMRGTRSLSAEELFSLAKTRVEQLYSYGIGTIEIKSGYGLSHEDEYKSSLVINQLKEHFSPRINIIRTFMAAHAIPKEFDSSSAYLKTIVYPLLEKLTNERLIDHIDIFHEEGFFSYEETEELFLKAKEKNLPVKIHADEFNDNKGALLATKYNALSVDHLLETSLDGINALANSETVANFLPGTGLFLGKKFVNARDFLDRGVKVSLASDYNPGSCHCDNLILLASVSAPLLKLNQAELWSALTLNAAAALGIKNQGAIKKGFAPRFSFFKCNTIDEITYSWGKNLAVKADQFIF